MGSFSQLDGGIARRVGLALLASAATWLALLAVPALAAQPRPSADPFYSYDPASIAGLPGGTVLRARLVWVPTGGVLSTPSLPAAQILYRTWNQRLEPTATVATVIPPPRSNPPKPTKLLSYQTYYDGLADSCRSSYTLQGVGPGVWTADDSYLLGWVQAGYTVVTSDYEGPADDYTAGRESGFGTLDGIRAALHQFGLPAATTPVGLVGYSGGSIASEWASELQPAYAAELHVAGVAVGGMAVDYAHLIDTINGKPGWTGAIPAIMAGLARAYRLDTAKYFNDNGQRILAEVGQGCIQPSAYPGLRFEDMLRPEYRNWKQVPELVRIFNDSIMGRGRTPTSPLFMGVGKSDATGDGVAVADDVKELAHTYCGRGVPVQFHVYNGVDHAAAIWPFEWEALQFMQQRYAGGTPANECASIGPGNSLTPLPMPSSAPVQPPTDSSPSSAAKHRKCRKQHHEARKRKCRKAGKHRA